MLENNTGTTPAWHELVLCHHAVPGFKSYHFSVYVAV